MTRVAIVGGGIAGLATAHAIRTQAPDAEVVLLEARDRIGGHIRTDAIDGYLCEAGPDGFLDNAPATLALAEALGIADRLVPSRDEARRRYIFRRDRLHEVPLSAAAFATSGLLSARAKLRVLAEPFAAAAPQHDETILRFAERHIGREAAHVLVGSMVSGIFAGDAGQLSLRACFPKMYELEKRHRSLVRAMLATRRERTRGTGIGAPAGRLTSFRGGMQDLVRGLAAALGPVVHTGRRITGLQVRDTAGGRPRLVGARAFSLSGTGRRIEADAVVLAGPADETADLVQPFAPGARAQLRAISTAPLAVVCLGYDAAALAAERGPLDGFGFLVPRSEPVRILGALWETSIYAGRAPAGRALLRVMIGGATDPGAVDLDDPALLSVVRADLRRTMGLSLAPAFVHIVRHWRGIPQYTTGHTARIERIEAALDAYPGLFLAGNAYHGVSINACVEAAQRVAARVAGHLRAVARSEDFAIAR